MNRNELTEEVVKWIEKLPAEKLNGPPAAVAVADTCAKAKSWTRLETMDPQECGANPTTCVSHIRQCAIRQAREDAPNEFDKRWCTAEQSTNDRPERELVLARLASKWDLEQESERLVAPRRRKPVFAPRRHSTPFAGFIAEQ